MFGLKGFGYKNKPRGFNYTPRYWDQQAHEREERRRQVLGDQYNEADDTYHPGSLIRQGRLRRMQHAERAHSKSRATIIRAAIFVILVGAVLWILAGKIGELF